MKKIFILGFFTVIGLALSTSSYAGWELYDDFSSGAIDTLKWSIDNSSANISVEDARAKFVHQPGNPNDSSRLRMVQNAENITGIRVTITVQSCTGDVRCRVSGYAGMIGENYIWASLQVKSNDKRIYNYVGLEGPPPDYTWFYDLSYNHFEQPTEIIGNSFNLTMMFYDDKIEYEVDGLGKITYRYENKIAPSDNYFRSFGTRSTNGDGPCTIYFDNVYVYRQTP